MKKNSARINGKRGKGSKNGITTEKTPLKQLTIEEQFRRQLEKQKAPKINSPSALKTLDVDGKEERSLPFFSRETSGENSKPSGDVLCVLEIKIPRSTTPSKKAILPSISIENLEPHSTFKVPEVPISSLWKCRKRFKGSTEVELFSPNRKQAKICSKDEEVTILEDMSDEKAQRSRHFLNKIPHCFEELKRTFIPLSPNREETWLVSRWSSFLGEVQFVLDALADENPFNKDDFLTIKQYYTMSENSQKLYAVLFNRQRAWIPQSKINYSEISEDLERCVRELVKANYLQGDDSLKDLETILKLLSKGEVKELCQYFNVKPKASKEKCIVSLRNNCSSFAPLNSSNVSQRRLENYSKKFENIWNFVSLINFTGFVLEPRKFWDPAFGCLITSGMFSVGSGCCTFGSAF